MKKEIKDKYILIDNETGECFSVDEVVYKKSKHITKQLIEHMIDNAENIMDIDINLLYSYLRSKGEINQYHQVKLKEMWCKDELFKIATDDEINLVGYFFNLLQYAHKWTNIIYDREGNNYAKDWKDVHATAGITNNGTKTKFKKFCEKHDLIRQVKLVTNKGSRLQKMIVNPFLYRAREHTDVLAIAGFNDLCKSGVNIDKLTYIYLHIKGLIEDK